MFKNDQIQVVFFKIKQKNDFDLVKNKLLD